MPVDTSLKLFEETVRDGLFGTFDLEQGPAPSSPITGQSQKDPQGGDTDFFPAPGPLGSSDRTSDRIDLRSNNTWDDE